MRVEYKAELNDSPPSIHIGDVLSGSGGDFNNLVDKEVIGIFTIFTILAGNVLSYKIYQTSHLCQKFHPMRLLARHNLRS